MRPVIASSESMAPMRLGHDPDPDPEPDQREDRDDGQHGPRPACVAFGGASATGVVGAAMVPVTPQPPRTIAGRRLEGEGR